MTRPYLAPHRLAGTRDPVQDIRDRLNTPHIPAWEIAVMMSVSALIGAMLVVM